MKHKIDDILPILENVKRNGAGYTAKCPAHDDNNNSFSIVADTDGNAVCNCFAGCSQSDIFAAINAIIGTPKKDTPTRTRNAREVIARYDYITEHGELIDTKTRYNPKGFSWKKGTAKRAAPLPLYHLTDVINNNLIFAVEGEKDADTLKAAGFAATNIKDGFTADNMKYLTGKTVLIIPDNDATGRKYARNAAALAVGSGAAVKVIDLTAVCPALPVKGDITDFIDLKGSIEDVIKHADAIPLFVPDDNLTDDNEHPHAAIYKQIEHYSINKKGVLIYSNGDTITPVCYGSLVILETIEKNNGTETELFFKVEGVTQSGRVLHPVIIPAAEFDALTWIRRTYGADIVAAPAQSAKQKLIAGVALTGQNAPRRVEYIHTGYITRNGAPVSYIHAGGNIAGGSELSPAVIPELSQFNLNGVSLSNAEKVKAINTSLQLLNVHAPGVVYPLYGFTFTAPLLPVIKSVIGDTGLCLYLQGKTQSGKSTLAALAMSHYGRFTSMTPSANFNSTANYINELSFYLKDAVLWVDDYHPQGTRADADKQNRIFQSIARAAGDHSSRGRLNSNAKIQTLHRPRCLFLATGEDAPQIGQSGTARVFTLLVTGEYKDQTKDNYKQLVNDAKTGVLSRCMSDYIDYIIRNYEDVKQAFKRVYDTAENNIIDNYGQTRLTTQTALIYTAFDLFISYAELSGAVNGSEADALKGEAWKQTNGAAANIETEINNQDPAKLYIKALTALISSGRRFLLNIYEGQALGTDNACIGWKDPNYYYFEPNAAYSAVCEYYANENAFFNTSKQTLHRELMRAGVLTTDNSNTPTTVKKIRNGTGEKSVRVLKVNKTAIDIKDERGRGL